MDEGDAENVQELTVAGRSYRLVGNPAEAYFRRADVHLRAPQFRQLARAVLRPDSVFLDIGANIGLTTLIAAEHVTEGRLIAVEPAPATFTYLRRNMALNGVSVQAENLAFGAGEGTVDFLVRPGGSAANHVVTQAHMAAKAGGPQVRKVRQRRVDDYLQAEGIDRVDFIKIDVEGYEIPVFEGMARTLAEQDVVVQTEFNAWALIAHADVNPRRFLEVLRATGMHVYHSLPKGLKRLESDADYFAALHHNLVRAGCVTDMVLSRRPIEDHARAGAELTLL